MRAFLLTLGFLVGLAQADVIECANGDRYNGKVLLVDAQTVKFQNENAGVLTIPREKVSTITFGAPAAKRLTPALSGSKTNATTSTAIQQIQNQYLSDASPEANQMFQEMVRDLLSGKMGVQELRGKAQETLKELQDLQKELGDEDTAALLGSYASILESFLKSGQAGAPTTPLPKPNVKTAPRDAEE